MLPNYNDDVFIPIDLRPDIRGTAYSEPPAPGIAFTTSGFHKETLEEVKHFAGDKHDKTSEDKETSEKDKDTSEDKESSDKDKETSDKDSDKDKEASDKTDEGGGGGSGGEKRLNHDDNPIQESSPYRSGVNTYLRL